MRSAVSVSALVGLTVLLIGGLYAYVRGDDDPAELVIVAAVIVLVSVLIGATIAREKGTPP